MSPNSHVVKWLLSSYRNILRRNHIKEIEAAVPECLRLPMRALEPLEPRVMLSSNVFPNTTKDSFVNNPFLTSEIKAALVNGINNFADKLSSLSANNNAFSTDVPGVLQYDTALFGPFQPPKPKSLTDLLNNVGGSTLGDLIKDNIADAIDGTALGTQLSAISVDASGTFFLTDKHYEIHLGSLSMNLVSGNTFEISSNITLKITDTDDDDLFFDLGRNADQFAMRPTTPNAYSPSFTQPIALDA